MALLSGRVLALMIAAGWVVAAGVRARSFSAALRTFGRTLLPVVLIWLADADVPGPGEPGGGQN
jgi:hypothetical protein